MLRPSDEPSAVSSRRAAHTACAAPQQVHPRAQTRWHCCVKTVLDARRACARVRTCARGIGSCNRSRNENTTQALPHLPVGCCGAPIEHVHAALVRSPQDLVVKVVLGLYDCAAARSSSAPKVPRCRIVKGARPAVRACDCVAARCCSATKVPRRRTVRGGATRLARVLPLRPCAQCSSDIPNRSVPVPHFGADAATTCRRIVSCRDP